jgi:hypothetical protein
MIQCKMFLSCGEPEPELSKPDQLQVGKISKLLGPLNVCPPCISQFHSNRILLHQKYLGWHTFQFESQNCSTVHPSIFSVIQKSH